MSAKQSDATFTDPLENYDNPKFDDPVEQALHYEPVSNIECQPYQCVDVSATVRDTMKLMTGRQITCVLVTDNGKLAGVFGDRDVLDKVALEYDTVMDGPVSAAMSSDPVYVTSDDTASRALAVMALSGLRHVPIVNHEHEPVGIVSPQRLTKFLQKHI